jgi:nicotinate-nucleotide pyrophosphorylase (carboxylating)
MSTKGMRIPPHVLEFIRGALREDIGRGDVTSGLLIPEGQEAAAGIVAKGGFLLAGLPFARAVFRCADDSVRFEPVMKEGSTVRKQNLLASVRGSARSILMAERVALNVLQRLSGIATLTGQFVKKAEGFKAEILDTRKTTPGMRYIEKYAVRVGGGRNHRFGLYDGILIKDNHIKAAGGIGEAVGLVRKARRRMKVEVEAANLRDVTEALEAGADIIMLDNMTLPEIREAVRFVGQRAVLEVSGNVTLNNVREIAATGVDLISIGALTHSAPAADISMRFE